MPDMTGYKMVQGVTEKTVFLKFDARDGLVERLALRGGNAKLKLRRLARTVSTLDRMSEQVQIRRKHDDVRR